MSEIDEALRAWARGVYTTEAGVELLIRGSKAVYEGAPWLTEAETWDDQPRMVVLDVNQLLEHSGAWSGGEQRLVNIAASLISADEPVDLSNAVPGLDRVNVDLVLAAIAHASGSHEHSEFELGADGRPTGAINRLSTLYGWPAA